MTTQTASIPIIATTDFVSLEDFLLHYSNVEAPFKYEWNNGIVEQRPRTMNREQFFIFQNLLDLFLKTKSFSNKGLLMCEVDMYLPFSNRTRRPDIAFLNGEQMNASRDGRPTVCQFVIEIISQNDQVSNLEDKKAEYFSNGVQILWVIYPNHQKVEVYRSLKEVQICLGDDICSADPVLPDFAISVSDIFA